MNARAAIRRARHLVALVCGFAVATIAGANPLVVKGELSFSSAGIGKVAECDTGREFTLGVMASNPYFQLVQKYWAISDHGKKPVLAEVRGEVMKTSDPATETTLQSPNVVTMALGACEKK